MNAIYSRHERADYDGIDAINISRLKELKRSPQHYQHAINNPKTSAAMTLGIATHVAVLEPERYDTEFVVYTGRKAGKDWESFKADAAEKTILTADEHATAMAIAAAVRADDRAIPMLAAGDPEVSMLWSLGAEFPGRKAKGRVDWLTSDNGRPLIVGLKTARDCRHFAFGSQSAKLGYHMQWAYYFDGYEAITGDAPRMIEIVVESAPPHAVAVYAISDDVIAQGRDDYRDLLKLLDQCELTGAWPGPQPSVEFLTLPSWAYPDQDDDISSLGLEA